MKKETKLLLGVSFLAGASAYLLAGYHAITYATKRYNKDKPAKLSKKDEKFIKESIFIPMQITTFDNLKLKGKLLKAKEESDKVIILIHGYHSSDMRDFGFILKFYHDLGYNILMPTMRAHGESEGDHIGFGYLDRLDILEWIHEIQMYFNFKPLQIVLHGESMGATTALMVSGESLSKDVKAIISDCGFSNALDEFKYVLNNRKIPSHLILPNAKLLSKQTIGYDIKDANALNMVAKSKTPTLFIHGDADDFVPVYMAYELYNACKADKELLIVEGANHTDSYFTNPTLYKKTIKDFLDLYIK